MRRSQILRSWLAVTALAALLSGCAAQLPSSALTRLATIEATLPVAAATEPGHAPPLETVLTARAMEPVDPPMTQVNDAYADPEQASVQHGVASFYASRFHGRTTASGERYNEHALTAAHRTLPIGTRVRVTNLANDRGVELTVNDRGPYIGNRLIDLSLAAARRLGFERQGLTSVRIDVLSPARASDAPASPAAGLTRRGVTAANTYRPPPTSLGIASSTSPRLTKETR